VGHSVGPDLSSIAARPKASLLVDVLDPSRQVPPEFLTYSVVTKSGRAFGGLIASEATGTITLRRNDAAEDTIARDEIEELRASGKSLMPDGMEQKLDQQAMADLFEFLYRPDVVLLKQHVKEKR
jgi:putative heme-binding domain-containing protein